MEEPKKYKARHQVKTGEFSLLEVIEVEDTMENLVKQAKWLVAQFQEYQPKQK